MIGALDNLVRAAIARGLNLGTWAEESEMADVDAVTLRIAIEAVDEKITMLSEALDADGSIQIDLLQHTKAAHKLEVAYKEATKSSSNMPAYESLIKN